MSEIRVLHLFSGMGAGGAEKMMLSLSKGLEERGIFSSIACPKGSYLHRMAVATWARHRLIKFKGSLDIVALISLMRTIRKDRITVLHAHQGKVFWPCVYAKWLTGGKVRTVFHRRVAMPHRSYSRRHYRYADGVIAIANAVAKVLTAQDGVDPAKIRVVYNGCDFARFNTHVSGADIRRKHGIADDAVVIGTVGAMNLPKGKGQGYLVDAVSLLSEKYPNLVCLIVGAGPFENELRQQATAARIENRVIFAGFQEEVEKYMAAMDIFTLNSWDTEGFGQVMVEAQALGKPVIGTDIGGIGETFVDNVTGLLIPPANSLALSAALRRLLDQPDRRIAMGQAGASFVREKFSYASMVDGVLEVYRAILAGDARQK